MGRSHIQQAFIDIGVWRCSVCCKIKPRDEFYANKTLPIGHQHYCKECSKKRSSRDHFVNREVRLKQAKQWKLDHPERNRELKRISYQRNRDTARARSKKWRDEHPEYNRQIILAWEAEHPEKMKEVRWLAKQTRCARENQAEGSFTLKEWETCKAMWNYACLACGMKEPDIALTCDHVIPLYAGGSNNITNIQPLCKSCNCKKSTKTIDYRSISYAMPEPNLHTNTTAK